MAQGGKSREQIQQEIDEFEAESKHRHKKEHRWYVCYYFESDPDIWWMMSARAHDETGAWNFALKKINRDVISHGRTAVMKYAKRVDADDPKKKITSKNIDIKEETKNDDE